MTGLLGPSGRPIASHLLNKKAAPPKTGSAFGAWAGRENLTEATLPGGGIVQFDLSKLTLQDFRIMRDHYQVNLSLTILSFMQHQSDWVIECENSKIAKFCDEQMRNNWTMLNRGMSTANWAGYSPMVLEWDNGPDRKVILSKVKDLMPEECEVQWKLEDGWAPPGKIPPKFKTYDGIRQYGQPWPVPTENTLWYPLLMEHGNYYGRKLLRPAFQSWFFSILLHLYANRYYERFGEPTPIGRAPFDDDIRIGNTEKTGAEFMLEILQRLRSRGVVVLPNDSTQDTHGRRTYDYEIDYMESQMRGADFERYMNRLDEEISVGLFTPVLLMRTADVGSYNLGEAHERVYQVMLNAMNDDRKMYLDKYVLSKMADYNFGENAPRPTIRFRKMQMSASVIKELMLAVINRGEAKLDIEELGAMAGMTITEIKQTTSPNPDGSPAADPNAPAVDPAASPPATPATGAAPAAILALRRDDADVSAVTKEIVNRVRSVADKAMSDGRFGGDLQINMGFKRRMARATGSADATGIIYDAMDVWLADVVALGADNFGGADDFANMFERVLMNQIKETLK